MTYRLFIEPTTAREIRSAVLWKTEHASPTVAARWYNGLLERIDTLQRHPSRCPLAAEDDKFPEEIRELLYGRHKHHKQRIIFTIRDDAVHVLYVRHTARDELDPDAEYRVGISQSSSTVAYASASLQTRRACRLGGPGRAQSGRGQIIGIRVELLLDVSELPA